jgi:hypothetical protein
LLQLHQFAGSAGKENQDGKKETTFYAIGFGLEYSVWLSILLTKVSWILLLLVVVKVTTPPHHHTTPTPHEKAQHPELYRANGG